jgi:Rps23 Pro-64 3,4-dihydroxylase Tpa1-like proline 4-hydroxylase
MLNHPLVRDFFDREKLANMAKSLRDTYASAQPFPHIVLDDFFPENVVEEVLESVEAPEGRHWTQFDNPLEVKRANEDESTMDPCIRGLLYQLNSAAFLGFLEELTGVEHLIPDPYFLGGGLHQIERGGFLKIHADFNYHSRLCLYRRLNLLLYLNKDWKEEYGGHFELWDTEMTACKKRVLPIFNRCVVFTTTDTSYHGHPVPLTCPEGRTRKSIALYYYTVENPNPEPTSHSTLWKLRPGETVKGRTGGRRSWKEVVKLLVPPALVMLAKSMTRRGPSKPTSRK